jgi:hypothetical protein
MSFDTLVQLILALLSGKGDLASAIISDARVLLIAFALTLLSISVALVKNRKYLASVMSMTVAAGLGATFYGLQQSHFDIHAGRVFIGGDLPQSRDGAERLTSLEACQRLCLANGGCVGFTYDQGTQTCFPKGNITSMHPFPSAISGIRRIPWPAQR